jgi:hypothetical protein
MSKQQRPLRWFVVAVAIALAARVPAARADAFQLVVKGGDTALRETPVVAEITAPIATGLYALRPSGTREPNFAQVFEDGDRRYVAAVLRRVAPKTTAIFTLEPVSGPSKDAPPGITFSRRGGNIVVQQDQHLLTELHIDDAGNKPFLFPLVGPTGASYTRAFPMLHQPEDDNDHPHQKSWWFTHGNVNGVDFWSEGSKFGKIRQRDAREIAAGPILGRLRTENDWLDPTGSKVCDDVRTLTFYRTHSMRLIDYEITIKASDGLVTFGDTKEGMFGLRVASTMDVDKRNGGKITNAEGLTDAAAWGQASAWVDYVGSVQGKTVGIAVLNGPGSFRFPTTWHVRTYGLFAANPFGWHDFGKPELGDYTIPAGEQITFSYRVILHEGDTKSAGLPQLFQAYAKPPVLAVERVTETRR